MISSRPNTTETHGANLAGAGNAASAIFDSHIVLPVYQLSDVKANPIGSLIYYKGADRKQFCEYRRGFKSSHIPIISPQ